jgi:hypothetical protein
MPICSIPQNYEEEKSLIEQEVDMYRLIPERIKNGRPLCASLLRRSFAVHCLQGHAPPSPSHFSLSVEAKVSKMSVQVGLGK